MKKLLIVVGLVAAGLGAWAQGSVNFANVILGATPRLLDAPIFNIDGTTRLQGSGFTAQLWAGTSANSLSAVGTGSPFLASAAGAGYFQGGALTIPNIAGGSVAFLQVRVWDNTGGATWLTSQKIGQSATFSLTLGGGGTPPSVPANLIGLTGFNLHLVPEPATLAFGVLGIAALFLRRRK